jgi:hypothetical protein
MTAEVIDRSFAAILKDIVGNIQEIIRAEMRLARAEVREEIGKAKRASRLMAIGALFCVMAFPFVLLAGVHLLANVVDFWLAALIVGVSTAAMGGALAAVGIGQLKLVTLPPPRTVTSVQENIQWAKAHTR